MIFHLRAYETKSVLLKNLNPGTFLCQYYVILVDQHLLSKLQTLMDFSHLMLSLVSKSLLGFLGLAAKNSPIVLNINRVHSESVLCKTLKRGNMQSVPFSF